jgi:hypothetical protein
MPLQPDRLDQAFELLRSRGTELGQSFSHELEERLMREQQKQLGRRRWKRPIIWASIAICSILAVGAGSYAATGGWRGWLQTFWIESDGTVTDQNERAAGESFQNENGTHITIIQPHGRSQRYEIRTEDSLKGRKVHLESVDP